MSEIGLQHYLVLSGMLFCTGMVGVLVRRNALIMLMSIELMLNAVNLTFVAFSRYTGNVDGKVVVVFVMTVAAAEAGVGLALAIALLKRFKEINLQKLENLKG